MTEQAVMGNIKQAEPPVSPIRFADGGDWVPPKDDGFDGDGRWDDGEGWKPSKTGKIDLLTWIGKVMSVGFVILGALGLWRWAMILLAASYR